MEKVYWYNSPKIINDNFEEVDGRIDVLEAAVGDFEQAVAVTNLTSSNLPATAASYSDLAEARTSVEALRAALETRLDASDAKLNALLTALRDAGIIAS